ncbi:MHYT domain-containing protein [Streptomonospora algeriensis]
MATQRDEHGGSGEGHSELERRLELLWGVAARPRRGPRPRLSLDAVVAAAVGLADAEGLGAVSMHYLGMASLRMQAEMHHDHRYTAAAAAIALLASTAALLFALHLRGRAATVIASLVMATAVSTMHYTAMFGVRVTALPASPFDTPVLGATMMDFFLPMFVGLGLLMLIVSLILMLSPAEDEADGASAPAPSRPPKDSAFARRD